ncbi:MAG: hypothetical protein IPP44_08535 [Ideonella sp.]|nr:hypothetical protein [Ideonella sp.]
MSLTRRRHVADTLCAAALALMALVAAALALMALVAAAADAAAASLPPIEAFFEEPMFGGASLSPNGRSLALRVGTKGESARLAVLGALLA